MRPPPDVEGHMAFADGITLTMLAAGLIMVYMGVQGFNTAFRYILRDGIMRIAVSALTIAAGTLIVWLGYTRGISLG